MNSKIKLLKKYKSFGGKLDFITKQGKKAVFLREKTGKSPKNGHKLAEKNGNSFLTWVCQDGECKDTSRKKGAAR